MMQNEPGIRVSIIVPCYNYGQFLTECLASILAQTYKHWECIIVDNASTDNTREVVEGFVKKDSRFSYHYSAQKGVSLARNLAVKISRGIYIFPVDADDKIAPTYVARAVEIIEKSEKIKVVYSNAELFGASSGKWELPPYNFKDLLIENSVFCTALYRKTDFEKAGGYNEQMLEGFEDWDFWIRMLKTGGEVVKINEVLFYYRIRINSRNSVIDWDKQMLLRRRIFENHKEAYEKNFSWPELIFEFYSAKRDLQSLRQSKELAIGRLVLAPLRWIKKIMKGN